MDSVLCQASRDYAGLIPDEVPDEVMMSIYLWGMDHGVKLGDIHHVRWYAGCIDASLDGAVWVEVAGLEVAA